MDLDNFVFVTSDTHFGHARIIELASRLFSTVSEMDAALIERWNAVVGPDDAVLHLGDVALGPIEESLAPTAHLNGRRFLVPGNHDRVSSATQTKTAIARFTPLYEQVGWTASHYPYRGDSTGVERHASKRPIDEGLPLIHGHTHARDHGPNGRMFHVGVDAHGFAPIRFELIDAWLDSLHA